VPFYRRDIRISKKGYGDIHVDEHDRLSNITLIVLYCSTFQCFISFEKKLLLSCLNSFKLPVM
jgi:hypothetical protein